MSFKWLEIAVGVGLLGLLVFEFGDRQFRESWYRDRQRIRRNLGFAAAAAVAMAVLKRINPVIQALPVPHLMCFGHLGFVELPLCFLAAELMGWLLHYIKHRNRFLWQFHFQHHRESEYNLWLTTHTHGLEVVVSGIITALALAFLGFSVLTIEIYLVYYGFMKAFQHSAHDYSFGVLDRLFITPRYHRLHHEVNSACNYGITLTLFDVLFRTAEWPAKEAASGLASYGLRADEAMPFGFWREMTFFLTPRPKTSTEDRRSR